MEEMGIVRRVGILYYNLQSHLNILLVLVSSKRLWIVPGRYHIAIDVPQHDPNSCLCSHVEIAELC